MYTYKSQVLFQNAFLYIDGSGFYTMHINADAVISNNFIIGIKRLQLFFIAWPRIPFFILQVVLHHTSLEKWHADNE